MKIEKAVGRKIPRKFELPWGKGLITEEASIKCSISSGNFNESWEPTIQLLEFSNGEKALRFCVYGNGKLRRMPLILDEEQAEELAKEIDANFKIKSIVKHLTR
ncbi:MAG: hypothetical protein QXN66_05560 [Thermoplasmatales archaeon]